MILADGPVCRPLRSQKQIPVIESTLVPEIRNERIAEEDRKRRARYDNCNRLAPGETPPLEQDLSQACKDSLQLIHSPAARRAAGRRSHHQSRTNATQPAKVT